MSAQSFNLSFAALGLGTKRSVNDTDCAVNIPGFTHHGDCDLLCWPASWKDIIVFYLANYIAHTATVVNEPGQSTLVTILSAALALFFPGVGIVKGVQAITSGAFLADTELQQAARAGALCIVVKDEVLGNKTGGGSVAASTTPVEGIDQPGDRRLRVEEQSAEIATVDLERQVPSQIEEETVNLLQVPNRIDPPKELVSLFAPKLHGICRLPGGYHLARLPRGTNARFENEPERSQNEPELSLLTRCCKWIKKQIASPFQRPPRRISISCDYNLVKIAVSMAQLVYTCITLYEARGDQIAMFGYAAFGLTVAQYAWMSLINLLGSLLCPQYSTMFLVGSSVLDELLDARKLQGKESEFPIEGVVGNIIGSPEDKLTPIAADGVITLILFLLYILLLYLISEIISILRTVVGPADLISPAISDNTMCIIGVISRFSANASEVYQCVWTMIWLLFGISLGPALGGLISILHDSTITRKMNYIWDSPGSLLRYIAKAVLLSLAPAIGGFVVVGQMINQYGVCARILGNVKLE
ncbi:hypothetical protein BKA56DRAFT_495746 [Ilyonectria sp. MPI-CAGE-AT-0026]|nr:hypothetical protein BKA56DRAFT_495746 [Ilyonectria sp. MPI-CAGE-AT-0026]